MRTIYLNERRAERQKQAADSKLSKSGPHNKFHVFMGVFVGAGFVVSCCEYCEIVA